MSCLVFAGPIHGKLATVLAWKSRVTRDSTMARPIVPNQSASSFSFSTPDMAKSGHNMAHSPQRVQFSGCATIGVKSSAVSNTPLGQNSMHMLQRLHHLRLIWIDTLSASVLFFRLFSVIFFVEEVKFYRCVSFVMLPIPITRFCPRNSEVS